MAGCLRVAVASPSTQYPLMASCARSIGFRSSCLREFMHIRTSDQVDRLSPEDYICWKAAILANIAQLLALNFTAEELSLMDAFTAVRAGYHLNELRELDENSRSDRVADVNFRIAEFLGMTFVTIELAHMDGDYDKIPLMALQYCMSFPERQMVLREEMP
jgi:hypothetical protein